MTSLRTVAAAGLCALLGMAAFAVPLDGYASFGRWSTTPVVVYVNPVNADVSASAAEAAIQAAMDVWNAQGQSGFRFVYGGRSSDTMTGHDGRSVVVFRNSTEGGGALASTYSWSLNGSLVDSDIVFWDGTYTFFTGSSGCSGGVYIEDVASHEFGHALGLSHSDQPTATMYPTIGWCSQEWRTLSSDDVAGVRALYPGAGEQPPSAPSALTVSTASASSLALAWIDQSSNESGFRVERSEDGSSFTVVGQPGTNTSSFTDTRLLAGRSYFYRVAAVNSVGLSSYSNVASGTTAAAINTAPVVTIVNPAIGAVYPAGVAITFSGSASDAQDGDISSSLVWTSSLDGTVGRGRSFSSSALRGGSHVITVRVTDSGGLTGTGQTTLTVTVSGSGGPSLTARGYKVKGSAKTDLSWGGSSVQSIDVYRNNAKLVTTANDGSHTDNISTKGGGTYSYKVCESGTNVCSNAVSVTF